MAFICVHNSFRSQIAEALGKHLAEEVFESHSAGTEIGPETIPMTLMQLRLSWASGNSPI